MYNVTVMKIINCIHNLLCETNSFILRKKLLFNQELKKLSSTQPVQNVHKNVVDDSKQSLKQTQNLDQQ